MKSGIEISCNTCPRDELDTDVCCRLNECGILTGVCALEDAGNDDTYEYPDIETKVKMGGVKATYGTRKVEVV